MTKPAIDRDRRRRAWGMALLVAGLFSVYTLTNSGGFHIIDEVSLFAVTESLGQRGAVDTNTIAWTQWVNSPGEVLGAFGPDGDVYSKKGPAPAFLRVPWYTLIRLGAGLGLPWGLVQGTLLWPGLVTALTGALLWQTARALGYDDRTGLVLGLLFGLATIAWPYANQLFGEPMSAAALLLALYGGLRAVRAAREGRRTLGHSLLAGLGAGVAVATVAAHGLLVALLGLYLAGGMAGWRLPALRPWPGRWLGPLAAFGAPVVGALLLLAGYNWVRFGHPLETGYHFQAGEGFTTPLGQGFWGLVFSPYRGVFWHTPLFLASVLAFPAFLRRHRAEALLTGGMSAVLVGLYSTWWMWWGGFAWGPRFLVPLAPFWVLWLAPWIRGLWDEGRGALGRKRRRLLGGLAVLSGAVQVLAVSVNYVNYEIELRTLFPTDWDDPLRYGPPAQSLADLAYSPVLGQARLAFRDLVAHTDLAWLWADGTVLWPVVGTGALVLVGWIGALVHWWRQETPGSALRRGRMPRLPGALALAGPLILAGVWLTEVGAQPSYGVEGQGYRAALAEIASRAAPTDGIVTVAPYDYQIPMNWYGGLYSPGGLPVYGYATDSATRAQTLQVLRRALQRHPRLWYVSGRLPAADPANTVERWLAEHAYKAEDRWFDDFRLLQYGTPVGLEASSPQPLDVRLEGPAGSVVLAQVQAPAQIRAGEVLPVRLTFRLETAVAHDLRWFVQLLDPAGVPVALLDTAPLDGYASFSALAVGEPQVERAGLAVERNVAPGSYRLIGGLYTPQQEGAPRLRTPEGADFVLLGSVEVLAP